MTEAGAGWSRELPLASDPSARRTERWRRRQPGRPEVIFDVDVRIGKPFDVLAMKGTDLAEIRSYAAFLCDTARRLSDAPGGRRRIATCPSCLAPTDDAPEVLRVFDTAYHRCRDCGHAFVLHRPPAAVQDGLFADSEGHAEAYVDAEAAAQRIAQIVRPKLEWVFEVVAAQGRPRPASVIDVGAGGGHFVACAREAGLEAEGFEISAASRRFARQAFGIGLDPRDFLTAEGGPVDLVTMWGLLEYVDAPRRFVEAARRRLRDGGLLVVEVPRFDALGTAAQAANPGGVARHMDPTSHVNCFSDASLATILHDCGFRPVAAWYFGMDAYELLVQAALLSADDRVLSACAGMIAPLQAAADAALLCDDVIVAAVPA